MPNSSIKSKPTFTGFKKQAHEIMMKNELRNGEGAYQLQHTGIANSGWSFGQLQWDLSSGNEYAKPLFKKILEGARNTKNKLLFSKKEATDLFKATIANASLSAPQRKKIDQALGSQYGRTCIDKQYSASLDKNINKINHIVEMVANPVDKSYLLQPLPKLFLFDYNNQYDISPNGAMERYLKGENAGWRFGQKQGDFDLVDLFKFFFSTKYFSDHPHDPIRRINNIWEVAKAHDIAPKLTEEDRQGIRTLYEKKISPLLTKFDTPVKRSYLDTFQQNTFLSALQQNPTTEPSIVLRSLTFAPGTNQAEDIETQPKIDRSLALSNSYENETSPFSMPEQNNIGVLINAMASFSNQQASQSGPSMLHTTFYPTPAITIASVTLV